MRFEPKQRFILNIKDRENQKFLIPEYQRPYRWSIDECQTLWNDMIDVFNEKKNNPSMEYFLGSIVSFENKEKKRCSRNHRWTTKNHYFNFTF